MKICIAVSEFNPFHNGHAEFLRQCRALTQADAVVCAMAGNFTQRGELAVLEKRTRAQLALMQGADAVIELPTPVAVSGAERFALGAVALFRGMKAELCLCCGSEVADSTLLTQGAAFFSKEPKAYRRAIRKVLGQGEPLPRAREQALFAVGQERFAPLVSNPNATLALEYAKACKRAKIPFFVYRRSGSHHNQTLPNNGLEISGSAIRTAIAQGETHALAPFLPKETLAQLPHALPNCNQGVFCTLLTKTRKELRRLPDCTEGLENRIVTALKTATDYADLCERVKSKRYVMGRIKRIFACALLGVQEKTAKRCSKHAPYLRLLGIKKGSENLLSALSTARAPLLTRRKEAEHLTGFAKTCFATDERAEHLFRLATGKTDFPFFVKG